MMTGNISTVFLILSDVRNNFLKSDLVSVAAIM